MKTDTLGRRDRAIRQPLKEVTHRLEPRDIIWLSFLHRHGGRLPTSYLHDYTKEHFTSFNKTSRRLKILFQEMKLIDRPFQQFETLDPRSNELVHEVSPKGLELLKDEQLFSQYVPTMRGAFKHQLMLSCISASFELNAKENGFEYIAQHHILNAIQQDHQVIIEGDKFTPDEVFMLKKDGKSILIFLEIDRGTEPTETESETRKSWTRSIAQYRKLIGHKLYKERFGVNCGALLMVVTVTPSKQAGILSAVKKEFDGPCNYILVHNIPEFGRIFHPPRVLDMLSVKWERCGHPTFTLT